MLYHIYVWQVTQAVKFNIAAFLRPARYSITGAMGFARGNPVYGIGSIAKALGRRGPEPACPRPCALYRVQNRSGTRSRARRHLPRFLLDKSMSSFPVSLVQQVLDDVVNLFIKYCVIYVNNFVAC